MPYSGISFGGSLLRILQNCTCHFSKSPPVTSRHPFPGGAGDIAPAVKYIKTRMSQKALRQIFAQALSAHSETHPGLLSLGERGTRYGPCRFLTGKGVSLIRAGNIRELDSIKPYGDERCFLLSREFLAVCRREVRSPEQ